MATLQESAMRLALAALTSTDALPYEDWMRASGHPAIKALNAALAQQEEPVPQARLGMKDGLAMALSVVELYGMKDDVIYREIAKLRDGIAAAPAPQVQQGEPEYVPPLVKWAQEQSAPKGEPVCHGCGIPAGDVHMSTCKSGKWPSRVSNGDTAAPAPQPAQGEPVYQYQMADGSWIDQIKDSYDYNRKYAPNATVRVVYTATPAPQPAQGGQHE